MRMIADAIERGLFAANYKADLASKRRALSAWGTVERRGAGWSWTWTGVGIPATVPREYKRAPKEWVRSELFSRRRCHFCSNSEPDGHTVDCEHPRAIAARKKTNISKEPRS